MCALFEFGTEAADMSKMQDIASQTISSLGLKLIKAFEGYRETASTLVTGQRVIGYGHPLDDDEAHEPVNREAALDLLRADVAPVEAMIRETVFTPLSQGQFDALCSLVFNIGPVNFMTSNIRHALNNGRILDAAGAFDEWRKADIDGKTYVVDALVRRRTAEKALFLRPDSVQVRAANASITVKSDDSYLRVSDDEIFAADAGVINAGRNKGRRAEDKGGILTLTERARIPAEAGAASKSVYDPINYADDDDMDAAIENHMLDIPYPNSAKEAERASEPSPIALAAAEVSDRLDALIDTARLDTKDAQAPSITPAQKTLPVAANSNEGRARRPANLDADRSKKFIAQDGRSERAANSNASAGIYGLFMFIGGCLLAGGLTVWITARDNFGPVGEIFSPWSVIIGGLLLLCGLYYGARALYRSRRAA